MKLKLAAWYMEKVWVNIGILREVDLFHKLFNVAYGVRLRKEINALKSGRMSEYQETRREYVSQLLQLQGVN